MISFKYKFIFIHAPKTAGNSIQNVLQKYSDDVIFNKRYKGGVMDRFGLNNFAGGKHATMSHYIRNWDESYGKIEDYLITGCVRNPYDRAVSYYFYLGNSTFECNNFEKTSSQLSPQTHYYCYNNENMLNYSISYEDIQKDFDNFCIKIGIKPEQLPKANVSRRKTKHFSEYIESCDRAKDIVTDNFSGDLVLFGYEK